MPPLALRFSYRRGLPTAGWPHEKVQRGVFGRCAVDRTSGEVRQVKHPNPILDSVDTFLRGERKFTKRGTTWYLKHRELTWVFNLQKSQYGGAHYLNVAIWLNLIDESEWPPEHKCHIRARLGSLADPDDELAIERVFDLDESIDEPTRRAAVLTCLNDILGPVLENVHTVEDLNGGVGREYLRRSLVRGSAQKLLSDRAT